MDLLPSPEQQDLVRTAAEFFAEQIPLSVLRERESEPVPLPTKLWLASAELGTLGLSAREDVGGSELGLDDEALMFRELGRALVPGPFLSSVLAAHLAEAAQDLELARSIVAGDVLVGLAQRRASSDEVDLVDVPETDYALVLGDDGAGLVATEDLLDVEHFRCLDPGTRLGKGRLPSGRLRCWLHDAAPVRLHGLVLVSSMLVGIAEAMRDLSVEHAKTRVQFGRPIGVHQAVKHACADMAVAAEAALQQTLFAAISVRSRREDAAFQVLAAKTVAADAALENARHAIQVCGGMGFTYEHDAHLFLKRAHLLAGLLADRSEALAGLIALDAAQ